MANSEHLALLMRGVEAWNHRKIMNPKVEFDLSNSDLSHHFFHQINFSGTNLARTNLSGSNLAEADLYGASLRHANLHKAYLRRANLVRADLHEADLREAYIWQASLHEAQMVGVDFRQATLKESGFFNANLRRSDLRDSCLEGAQFLKTNLEGANLEGASIYGISAWDLELSGTRQTNLIITRPGEPIITVDNLEVAQFIYLLLNNEKIRHVIDTITSKVVLILGRFTPERKAILDAIQDELRRHDLLPVMFDFQKPDSRDFTETVSTLAHMARFVIADMTDSKIVLEEVPHIVRNIAVPLVPLLLEGEDEPVTLYNLRNQRSLLPTCRYTDRDALLASLEEKVILPAQAKLEELWEMR